MRSKYMVLWLCVACRWDLHAKSYRRLLLRPETKLLYSVFFFFAKAFWDKLHDTQELMWRFSETVVLSRIFLLSTSSMSHYGKIFPSILPIGFRTVLGGRLHVRSSKRPGTRWILWLRYNVCYCDQFLLENFENFLVALWKSVSFCFYCNMNFVWLYVAYSVYWELFVMFSASSSIVAMCLWIHWFSSGSTSILACIVCTDLHCCWSGGIMKHLFFSTFIIIHTALSWVYTLFLCVIKEYYSCFCFKDAYLAPAAV